MGGAIRLSSSHAAGPLLPEVLESAVARSLIGETEAGLRLIAAVEADARVSSVSGPVTGGPSSVPYDRFLRLLTQDRFRPLAESLTARLSGDGAPLADAALFSELDSASLSAEQRQVLEVIAGRLLRLRSDWTHELARAESGTPSQFFSTAEAGSAVVRSRFLEETAPGEVDPAFETGTLPMTDTEAEPFISRWKRQFSEMNRCVDEMPSTDRKAAERRWALQGFIQSQLFTIGGNILGSKTVDWKSLPTDMLVSLLWSGVSSKALFSSTRVTVQWLRLELSSQSRSGLDAVIYFLNPYKDTHGKSNLDATWERSRFNMTYNLFSPLISISTHRLLMGLECLFPGGRIRAVTSGLRFTSQVGSTLLYYRLRSEALNP